MNDLQKYYLLESAKWQKLLGVLMWICTIFMVLLGLFFIVAGILGLDMGDESLMDSRAAVIIIGVVYILCSVLYYFFARYLCRSARGIKTWNVTGDETDLTDGLRNSKNYFQFSGILAIVGLALVGVCLIAVVIALIVSL